MTDGLNSLLLGSGFFHLTLGMLVMWVIAFVLIYLAIAKEFEPLLLLPIGFGILLANLPLSDLMEPGQGLLWRFYHHGIQWEVIPPLIFLGLGALTDFRPMLANPRLIFLGAAAQGGVYVTFFAAHAAGMSLEQAASIGIIGGADGPTTIYLTSKLAPELLGSAAVAAYSYMALVPIIQPPIMKGLTTKAERVIRMKKGRKPSNLEVLLFPLAATIVVVLLVPPAAALISMLMLGNLFREAKVVERLTKASQNELLNIVTIFLGLPVGATMNADTFLRPQAILIFLLGLVAFAVSTACGVLLAKGMNLVSRDKINPLIGAAGVSAVPMSARVVHRVAAEADKKNYLLMYAMGPNVAGVIGTVIAAGVFLTLLR